MKRRYFLKSVGAAVAVPMLPGLSVLANPAPVRASAIAIGSSTYKWAEVIARAHKSCSVAMLQRHLRLDVQAATALKSELVRNGVISAQMNALGMNKAVKPLFDGAFIKPSDVIEKAGEIAKDVVQNVLDNSQADDSLSEELADEQTEDAPIATHDFDPEAIDSTKSSKPT